MKLNVVVDWNRMGWQDMTPDMPVDVHLRNVPLITALDTILQMLGNANSHCSVRNGIIEIPAAGPTYEDETEVYDLRELLEDYARYDRHRPLTPPATQPVDPYRRGVLTYVNYLNDREPLEFGSYDELSGRLIVTAPPQTHAHIWELLQRVRHPIHDPSPRNRTMDEYLRPSTW